MMTTFLRIEPASTLGSLRIVWPGIGTLVTRSVARCEPAPKHGRAHEQVKREEIEALFASDLRCGQYWRPAQTAR